MHIIKLALLHLNQNTQSFILTQQFGRQIYFRCLNSYTYMNTLYFRLLERI